MQPEDNAEAGKPLTHIKPTVLHVLKAASYGELWVKGTLARVAAWDVAEAASRGWLTTEVEPFTYGTRWRLTTSGTAMLHLSMGHSE